MHACIKKIRHGLHVTVIILMAAAWSNVACSCGGSSSERMHNAVVAGNTAEVAKLLKENQELLFLEEPNGDTALHVAAFMGHKEMVRLLLAERADVNARAHDGDTPLHEAADRGNIEVAKLLLAHGADINALDNQGWTPLRYAMEKNQTEVAVLLRHYGGLSSPHIAPPVQSSPSRKPFPGDRLGLPGSL